MAIKTLRHFATNPMEMVAVLTTAWSPLQGAPQHVIDEIKNDIGDHHLGRPNSALEVRKPPTFGFLTAFLKTSFTRSQYHPNRNICFHRLWCRR
jgi:hypothetical protein